MRTILFIILIASTGLFACKTPSKAMGASDIIPSPDKKSTPANQNDQDNITYDLIISFISKGAGIDHSLKDKIDAIITEFNNKNNVDLKYDKTGWGREGEVDYNFILKNLSTDQKKSFISSIKEAIGSSDMAQLTFNQKSVHKR